MQAVLLAAGKSTRAYPLTITRPKPLLKAAGTTIIEHNLDQLAGIADEAIIVVSYLKEQIKGLLRNSYKGIRIRYAEQKEPLGSGDALYACRKLLKGRFIVMNGDDLFHKKDIRNAIGKGYGVLADKRDVVSNFGVFVVEKGRVVKIVEKPAVPISKYVNTGLYVLDDKIFDITLTKSARGEYEITQYLEKLLARGVRISCAAVSEYWVPIGYPWDLLNANSVLLSREKGAAMPKQYSKNVTVDGMLTVGKGTRILGGVHIEGRVKIGEDCKIGPNCYIRGDTSIGDRCHIGQAVEIKNSIIMDGSKVPHLSYIGDSVIGENVNLGAGTITANLRHDNTNIKTLVKGALVDTGRRKLGAIIGDNVHTGIHTSIYPGRKIWPNMMTLPGSIITKDIEG